MIQMTCTVRLASALLALGFGATACGSSGPPADTTSLNGPEGAVVGGTGSVTGMYGTEAIAPVMAAYWIGQPDDPTEAHGGPFVYLLSQAVTCNAISVAGWLSNLDASTQALEMIVGTTTVGAAAESSANAGANISENNYLFGRVAPEIRATSGSVTLTAYTKDVAVDGTVSIQFPAGSAAGTFHAVYCPGGQEESR